MRYAHDRIFPKKPAKDRRIRILNSLCVEYTKMMFRYEDVEEMELLMDEIKSINEPDNLEFRHSVAMLDWTLDNNFIRKTDAVNQLRLELKLYAAKHRIPCNHSPDIILPRMTVVDWNDKEDQDDA